MFACSTNGLAIRQNRSKSVREIKIIPQQGDHELHPLLQNPGPLSSRRVLRYSKLMNLQYG
jgi:hypothetical protein